MPVSTVLCYEFSPINPYHFEHVCNESLRLLNLEYSRTTGIQLGHFVFILTRMATSRPLLNISCRLVDLSRESSPTVQRVSHYCYPLIVITPFIASLQNGDISLLGSKGLLWNIRWGKHTETCLVITI